MTTSEMIDYRNDRVGNGVWVASAISGKSVAQISAEIAHQCFSDLRENQKCIGRELIKIHEEIKKIQEKLKEIQP
jgi:hypothetical protein